MELSVSTKSTVTPAIVYRAIAETNAEMVGEYNTRIVRQTSCSEMFSYNYKVDKNDNRISYMFRPRY